MRSGKRHAGRKALPIRPPRVAERHPVRFARAIKAAPSSPNWLAAGWGGQVPPDIADRHCSICCERCSAPTWHATGCAIKRGHSIRDREGFGGPGRNRTGIRGFAVRCITTLPPDPRAQARYMVRQGRWGQEWTLRHPAQPRYRANAQIGLAPPSPKAAQPAYQWSRSPRMMGRVVV